VFFIGAGASVDEPSNLPSFLELAMLLAGEARVPFNKHVAIETFLGSMPSKFNVHARTCALISREESKPNSTHKAIVRVASSIKSARIVTTNFDDHLWAAAHSEPAEISERFRDRWISPALPMGDKFTGVVHLHGSVLRDASELVLTDRDFGRAYLTEAWATRFLQKMFETFTVLFIGYSLDDPLMTYLSRGLPSDAKRYVLTHKPYDEKWGRLLVKPISYPRPDGDHSALVGALQAWDSQARMGHLDHSARMRKIVDRGTSLTLVDHDYVRERLRTQEGASQFGQTAKTIPWLKWAEDLPEFKALFDGGKVGGSAAILANWFGGYVQDPNTQGEALQTVARLGQKFAPALVDFASRAADNLSIEDEQAGRKWKVLLSTSIHGHSAPPEVDFSLPHPRHTPGYAFIGGQNRCVLG